MNTKTLYFEGAGWPEVDSSKSTDVGNCRIRTRIRNNDGRLIYLELGGTEVDKKKHSKNWMGYNYDYFGYVSSCYYADSKWDSRRYYSMALKEFELIKFEYTKENIIKFVNENLNCSFDSMHVINDGSVFIHDNNDPLSDCSTENNIPYQEEVYNISELVNIDTFIERDNFARFNISYDFIKELLSYKRWTSNKTEQELERFSDYRFNGCFRWDKVGIIYDAEITATENDFPTILVSHELLGHLIEEVKRFSSSLQTV